MAEKRTRVTLHLYDLSQGMARAMSMSMIGKQLDGIWHSGIVVFGTEYFYGGGICAAPAGRAIPHLQYEEIVLGDTRKSQEQLEVFLQSINARFTTATYSLLRHNCNNFADEVSQYLLGHGIPEHIIRLPQEFLTSPMGAVLAPMIQGMEQRMRDEMVGDGRGLNPFAHIQGGSPSLLLSVASLGDSADVDEMVPEWLDEESSSSLLKTAVDGIPEHIMSSEIKRKVIQRDASVSEQLVDILKKNLRNTTPVLMTFNVLVRFYWNQPLFRNSITHTSPETLNQLIGTSLKSNNLHVVSAALSAGVNISASIDPPSFHSLEPVLKEVSAFAHSANLTQSQRKHIAIFFTNCLITLPIDKTEIENSNDLLNNCFEYMLDLQSLTDLATIKRLCVALERRASKLFEHDVAELFKCTVDPEKLLASIEELQSLHGVSFKQSLMLIFQ